MGKAQYLLLKVAERKNSSNELRAMLAKGIADFYNNSIMLMGEIPLSKYLDDRSKIYVAFQKQFFNTTALLKYKDFLLEAASKTGEGYGKVVALFDLAAKSANQPIKDLVSLICKFFRQKFQVLLTSLVLRN